MNEAHKCLTLRSVPSRVRRKIQWECSECGRFLLLNDPVKAWVAMSGGKSQCRKRKKPRWARESNAEAWGD